MVYVGTYDCYKNFKINDLQSAYYSHDKHPDWLKIDLNTTETRTAQDYKRSKNSSEWKDRYVYIVLKIRVKQVTFGSNI